jgi:hypothetical protein
MTMEKFFIDGENTVLLIVDIQDRLAAVMKERDKVIRNNIHLVELAKMSIPAGSAQPSRRSARYYRSIAPSRR